MKEDFKNRLIRNGYSENVATELVNDIIAFTEKHSVSCLEDSFHYFMESLDKEMGIKPLFNVKEITK